LDSAYVGYEDVITKQKLVPEIIEKNYRNTQLTDEQKESNRNKARKRCRIEHVFGFVNSENKKSKVYCNLALLVINFLF
jgi:lipid A disaccharide synthetase